MGGSYASFNYSSPRPRTGTRKMADWAIVAHEVGIVDIQIHTTTDPNKPEQVHYTSCT